MEIYVYYVVYLHEDVHVSCNIYLYITGVSGSLGTRAPSTLYGNPGCFLRVSDLRGNRGRNKRFPSPEMSTKRLPKWVSIGHSSSPEEFLKCLHAKRLQCQIRTCLPMFAAYLGAYKSNILLFAAAIVMQIWFQIRMLKTDSYLIEKRPT